MVGSFLAIVARLTLDLFAQIGTIVLIGVAAKNDMASGTMTGRVAGTHISGKDRYSVCAYSFALDRS